MTLREFPRPRTGGTVRRLGGALLTLCALIAVLLHHELPNAPVATVRTSVMHTEPHLASMPATTHTRAGSAVTHTRADGTDGADCPCMCTHLCSAAGITAVQLAAPPESPLPVFPAPHSTVAGGDAARSVGRAPPDLSVLSQLRI